MQFVLSSMRHGLYKSHEVFVYFSQITFFTNTETNLIPGREGGDELLVFGPGDDWRRYALYVTWEDDIFTHCYRHLQQLV